MVEQAAHSSLGPSGASRWSACAGSVKAERGLPDNAGIYAAEGSCFHHFADLTLTLGVEPHFFIGEKYVDEKFGAIIFTEDMADHMVPGLDFLLDISAAKDAVLYTERQVDLSRWLGPGQFGTCDAAVIAQVERHMTIQDWKYGTMPVLPVDNDQGILYAAGFWADVAEALFGRPDGVTVDIVIEQPRAPGGGGVWSTDMTTILARAERLGELAKLTEDPNAPRVAGPVQCKFCRAASARTCREHLDFIFDAIGADFDSIEDFEEYEPPKTGLITPLKRSALLKIRPMVDRFFNEMHASAFDDAQKGREVPGLKLIEGRSPPRKWLDPVKADRRLRSRLGDDAYVRKLVSPAQAEKIIGKKPFAEKYSGLVDYGKPTLSLVDESVNKPAAKSVVDLFDDL